MYSMSSLRYVRCPVFSVEYQGCSMFDNRCHMFDETFHRVKARGLVRYPMFEIVRHPMFDIRYIRYPMFEIRYVRYAMMVARKGYFTVSRHEILFNIRCSIFDVLDIRCSKFDDRYSMECYAVSRQEILFSTGIRYIRYPMFEIRFVRITMIDTRSDISPSQGTRSCSISDI
ncbi:unnamed protein product [Laminaria digitata]